MSLTTFSDLTETFFVVHVGVLLLSLDAISARYEAIGLQLRRPDSLVQAARKCLEWSRDPRNGRPSAGDVMAHIDHLLEVFGDREDAAFVGVWLRRYLALRRVGWLEDAWGPIVLLFDDQQASALRLLGARRTSVVLEASEEYGNRLAQIESLSAEIESAITSDWDRAEFALYRQESDLVSPINFLSAHLSAEAFLKAFSEILKNLSQPELDLFEGWAQAAAGVYTSINEAKLSMAHAKGVISACSEE